LPSGLVLDPVTGVISSNPLVTTTTANAFTVTFRVTDSAGLTASNPVTLRLRPRTDRASIDAAGNSVTGSSNIAPSINQTGGRFITFSSNANLVAGVTGNQVYVHDRQTGQPSLVSRDNNSSSITQGNGSSSTPSISGDGRFVAFVSQATNLLAPAAPVVAGQAYVRDTQTNQTSLVSQDNSGGSVPGNAASSTPSISGDGRFVAFVSQATNLLAPAAPVVAGQAYVRDTQTNQTSLVSQDNSGGSVPGNAASSTPFISGDGRFVAFVSQATNLLAPAAPVVAGQAYVRDTQTNQTSLVSQDNSGGSVPGNAASSTPFISGDGRFVAFVSSATNLVTVPPASAVLDVYIRAIP
jgi:Tol biopolymer transport system component